MPENFVQPTEDWERVKSQLFDGGGGGFDGGNGNDGGGGGNPWGRGDSDGGEQYFAGAALGVCLGSIPGTVAGAVFSPAAEKFMIEQRVENPGSVFHNEIIESGAALTAAFGPIFAVMALFAIVGHRLQHKRDE